MSRLLPLKILFAVGLLAWLYGSGRLDISPLLQARALKTHCIGLTMVAASLLLQLFRWWVLLKAQNFNLSFYRAVRLGWIGFFLSLPLPGMAGGMLTRGYLIAADSSKNKIRAISTVILDRIIGLLALFSWALLALFLVVARHGWDTFRLYLCLSMTVICAAAITSLLLFWFRTSRVWLVKFLPRRIQQPMLEMAEAYRTHGARVLISYLLSLALSVPTFAAFLLAGIAAGSPVSWQEAFQVVPLVFVAGSLPIAPDGLGVAETASGLLFSQLGVSSGATIMLIYRLWLLLLRLPGGLIFPFHKLSSD